MTATLMLVSAAAGAELRREVGAGRRPCPEFLELERRGVELLDWTRLPGSPRRRSPATSALHVAAALRRLGRYDAVFSDGENVGLPLALAMRATGRRRPHLMLSHHLSNGRKPDLVRRLRPQRRIDRVLVHSPRQLELATGDLGLPADLLALEPYFADTAFWSPRPVPDEALLVSAGLEHRDYATLVEACRGLAARVRVAAGSVHSPAATTRLPAEWPATFEVAFADHVELRRLYARARVVVVPVVESDFQAGVTTVLEAMAVGRPVVATAARGWSGVIEDGETGLLVPPGDAAALRAAIERLLDDAALRTRLGRRARAVAVERYGLEGYCDRLLRHLRDIT
jgi:glycosyltransferase involved in cell wall biosynthesis